MTYSLAILFLAVFILVTSCTEVPGNRNAILWDDSAKKLDFDDFLGPVPKGAVYDVGSYIIVKTKRDIIEDSISLRIATYFLPNISYSKIAYPSKRLLDHEQHHFALYEIRARKLREWMSYWDGRTVSDFDRYLANGKGTIFDFDPSVSIYDTETNHSLNIPEQKKWSARIDSLLDAYKKYQNPVMKFPWYQK